ncbi:hypothetical protein Gocc_3081 [Gaiella occulta]|uniref:Uncharacterized protein n=1 Tax=Gaiella occulta TaxID=1002870 RepID=A0A7M2YSP5_9ACTN|nr:hypothetical protein [Gaiella occulta]RDI73192.1 hypothetical protein Gocc_3081 [Gaiella occulta]
MEASGELAGGGVGEVERYERLRRSALSGEPDGWRLGLALLERRGVAAWTRAWQETAPAPSPARTGPAVEAPVGAGEIVGVLAAMALACLAGR